MPLKSSQRFQELSDDGSLVINKRPRVRSRLATGRSKLHFEDRLKSDPVSAVEVPVDVVDGTRDE